jgi:hypothetical protein
MYNNYNLTINKMSFNELDELEELENFGIPNGLSILENTIPQKKNSDGFHNQEFHNQMGGYIQNVIELQNMLMPRRPLFQTISVPIEMPVSEMTHTPVLPIHTLESLFPNETDCNTNTWIDENGAKITEMICEKPNQKAYHKTQTQTSMKSDEQDELPDSEHLGDFLNVVNDYENKKYDKISGVRSQDNLKSIVAYLENLERDNK